MKGTIESTIERLSVYYYRAGKLVKRTNNLALLVMVWSVVHKRNAQHRDLLKLYMRLGGARSLYEIDRKVIALYFAQATRNIKGRDRLILKPRYARLGFALWSRGYAIWSYSKYVSSLNHFVYSPCLTSLGLKEIDETIIKIKKSRMKYGYSRRQIIYPYERIERR